MSMKRLAAQVDECVDYRDYNQKLKEIIDYETLGYHMKEARLSRQMTQAAVAEKMHWSTKYYASIESGKREISLHKLIEFICLMRTSADQLLSGCRADYPTSNLCVLGSSELRRHVNRLIEKCGDSELQIIATVAEGLLAKR